MSDGIRVTAPVRICDCGGWTDTWFAGRGAVLSVAITPGVDVVLDLEAGAQALVTVRATNFGDEYTFAPGQGPGRHPILESAVDAIPPPGGHVTLTVSSTMPPGASTGTSAAVAVAALAALDALAGGRRTPDDLAREAHDLETRRLGLESGVQDQIAAAHGGVNFIEIDPYPEARVTAVPLPEGIATALEERLVLVYLGRAHQSSPIHREVIAGITAGRRSALDELAAAAREARDALASGDLRAFGRALDRNTTAQAALHPSLVAPEARRVGTLAAGLGAWGWKVNGAGGDGGSVSILLGQDDPAGARQRLVARLRDELTEAREVPVRLSPAGVCRT
jgi:D-glycero-alpha-D-manno-heptose-7-phosphate kinase